MFSIREILFTVVVVVVVWLAFGWIRRAQQQRVSRGAPTGNRAGGKGAVEDLVACTICGAYGPTDAGACGRPDCQRT